MEQVITTDRRKSRWGLGILALWGGFALFTVVLALIAAFQDVSLVETNYYEKGLAHQGRIDEMRRAASLSAGITVVYDPVQSELVVTFPPECRDEPIESHVRLYRPSNARWDREFAGVHTGDGTLRLPVARLVPGLWKLQVQWQWRNESYYREMQVFVPA